MSVYNLAGNRLYAIYNAAGSPAAFGFDIAGDQVFPDYPVLPVPAGDLNADSIVPLPDLYGTGHGWTCTGLAYDEINHNFIIGDIGILLPGQTPIHSQLLRVSDDFSTVIETISLYNIYPSMSDVQGVTIDTSDHSIWCCCPSTNTAYHLTAAGTSLGTITVTNPTGIIYDPRDDTLWILTTGNKINHITKTGTVLESFDFAYTDGLDQGFLDPSRGVIYITAGANYQTRNNVYTFNTTTHEQGIACTVDSYSVEGIWIGETEMVIVNDGYYHSAYDNRNVACIYDLS